MKCVAPTGIFALFMDGLILLRKRAPCKYKTILWFPAISAGGLIKEAAM